LEQGISIAEVARALEVNPNVLHRWRSDQLLSLRSGLQAGCRWRPAMAGRDPAHRPWSGPATDDHASRRSCAPPGVEGKSEAGVPSDARRQLLCRRRKFLVTTDSDHGRTIYPNLARELVLTGVNQLWIADLTYIRLLEEFVFLAAILDAFSRRVIGWALDRARVDDELTLTALRRAIARHAPLASGREGR
jgi:transposase InsO family protein